MENKTPKFNGLDIILAQPGMMKAIGRTTSPSRTMGDLKSYFNDLSPQHVNNCLQDYMGDVAEYLANPSSSDVGIATSYKAAQSKNWYMGSGRTLMSSSRNTGGPHQHYTGNQDRSIEEIQNDTGISELYTGFRSTCNKLHSLENQ